MDECQSDVTSISSLRTGVSRHQLPTIRLGAGYAWGINAGSLGSRKQKLRLDNKVTARRKTTKAVGEKNNLRIERNRETPPPPAPILSHEVAPA